MNETHLRLVPALVFLTACCAFAETAPRTISVTGTAVMQVPPDAIVWSVTSTDNDKDLLAAKEQSQAKMAAIMAAVEELGVSSEDVQSGRLNTRKEYERDNHGNRAAFKHYAVTRHVTVKQHELARFDEFLEGLVGAGEVEVNVQSTSSKVHEHRWENRLEAMRIAKEKAEAMLETLDANLGRVLTVDEHPRSRDERYASPFSNASNVITWEGQSAEDRVSGTYAPDAIEVRTTVYVTFEIE